MTAPDFKHAGEETHAAHTPRPSKRRRVLDIVGAVSATLIVLTLIPATLAIGYDQYFANKIFPSTKVLNVSVSGLTREEATKLLTRETNALLENGINFTLNGSRYNVSKTTIDSQSLVTFDIPLAVEKAFTNGRTGSLFTQAGDRYRSLLAGKKIPLAIEVDEQSLTELVSKNYANEVKIATDASPQIKLDGNNNVTSIGISAAENGASPRFLDAVATLKNNLTKAQNPSISIPVDIQNAQITLADAEPHMAELTTLLAPREIKVTHENGTWTLTRRDVAAALSFVKTENDIQAGLDTKKLAAFFKPIRKVVEVPAQSAVFTMKGDEVVEFKPHKNGVGIDETAFAAAAKDALYQSKAGMTLPMKETEPEITNDKSNNLGIKEPLGTGFSSYKGSPANRIKNIQNGVKRLNLSLIAPDEEFSLVTVLKPFDAEGGYVPELVIKGSKLEPEIGGGLCQIGTTTFRAVMNSGLPITERQNHSLVVSYYNDPENGNPGSDATIYDPNPDFKFKNDTGHYLLIVAEYTAKQALYFTIYGTSDGRVGSYEAPQVSKWTPVPKETGILYLESASVSPGKQSCKAGFPGAVASMKYTIKHADGTATDRIFTSIYRMLPPVCLVAKGEIPPPTPETPATPSPATDIPIPAADTGGASQ